METCNSFLSNDELKNIGFAKVGQNVLISRKVSIYSPSSIIIGNNVRVDDFCILSGHIEIGDFVHVSAYSALYGRELIQLSDYSGVSPRVTIFSAVDDFSGEHLIGPMAPVGTTKIVSGPVIIERFVQIGASVVVLPNLIVNEGSVVGAMSLVNKTLGSWGIYAGIPAKLIKNRSKALLKYVR